MNRFNVDLRKDYPESVLTHSPKKDWEQTWKTLTLKNSNIPKNLSGFPGGLRVGGASDAREFHIFRGKFLKNENFALKFHKIELKLGQNYA